MNKKAQKQVRDYMKRNNLSPFCNDGGCSSVEVSDDTLLNALKTLSNQQEKRLKKTVLI